MERPPEAHQHPPAIRRLDIVVDAEQVFVIGEQPSADHERHPQPISGCKCRTSRKQASHRAFPIRPKRDQHRPRQRGQEKDRRRLGQHHQREQQPDSDRRQNRPSHVSQPHPNEQRCQHERGQQRLQNGQPAEAIEERTGHQQRQGQQSGPATLAAAQQQVAQSQIGKEEEDRQPARGPDRHTRCEEQQPLQKRPHRQRYRRIEVTGYVPVAEQVLANRGVPIPAFIGVLGPVADPRRVIREIRGQVERVEDGKAADQHQPCSKHDALCPSRHQRLPENKQPEWRGKVLRV